MDLSIIVIGDELLIGQVTDTNSGWIARNMAPLGWSVKSVKVVADNSEEILNAINQAFAETDVILTTGGLGPTKDDITKPTLCKYFGGELRMDEPTRQNVLSVVSRRHIKLNDLTEAQAIVPTSCRVIQNEVGTAPIMWFEKDSKVLVAMPGVPFETETMMQRQVIPQLLERFCSNQHIAHHTFVVINYIESALAATLDEFERQLPEHLHLAYLPSPGIIRLRLSGKSSDKDLLDTTMNDATEQLHSILGDSIISDNDITLEEILGNELKLRHLTLATAESCTGGNIAHRITEIPGSSEYFIGSVVSYCNEVKQNVLHVSADTLKAHGAVSEPTVTQMCRGVSELLNTDCAVATSGVAGPGGGSKEKPVGTVWMAAKCGDTIITECRQFPGSRQRVIDRASTHVMTMLLKLIKSVKH